MRVLILFAFLLCACAPAVYAQHLQGLISDIGSRQPLSEVFIENVHTGRTYLTDSSGTFSLEAGHGQLVEFRKPGYKTERLRVPDGIIPPYFKVFLEEEIIRIPENILAARGGDWKKDSLHYYELYNRALEFKKFSTLDKIRHPFSAMSKTNRRIWAFQGEYSWFEQEKFIDYTFNARVIGNLTGLTGDSLQTYLSMYRPSYTQLRNMTEYDFYNFIRRSVQQYRSGYNPRRPPVRGGE